MAPSSGTAGADVAVLAAGVADGWADLVNGVEENGDHCALVLDDRVDVVIVRAEEKKVAATVAAAELNF